jgi:hypothetical protein
LQALIEFIRLNSLIRSAPNQGGFSHIGLISGAIAMVHHFGGVLFQLVKFNDKNCHSSPHSEYWG